MAVDRKAVADALAQANAQTGLFRTDRPTLGPDRGPCLTPEQRQTRRILVLAEITRRTCAHVRETDSYPAPFGRVADCPKCAAAFVAAVRRVLDAGEGTAP